MYLQLAEKPKRRKGEVRVSGYNRSGHVNPHSRKYPVLHELGSSDPYLFVPIPDGGGIYVHESKFDKLPDSEFKKIVVQLAPFQPEVEYGIISEPMFLASRQERKASRQKKKDLKNEEKESRTKRREERTTSRAETKASREQRKSEGKGFDFKGAIDTVGGVIGKFKGGSGSDADGTDTPPPSKPFYTNPLFIGGAIAIVGGAIYLGTRKK